MSAHFQATAAHWEGLYSRGDLYAAIYRQRLRIALDLVDGLGLPVGSRVLEVGCGPGYGTAALTRRGFDVTAIDAAKAMVDMTRARVAGERPPAQATVLPGDVRRLGFAGGAFRLVFALGVMEWLDSPDAAMQEMARVLAREGVLIASTDNRWAAHRLLDPALSPLLTPVKDLVRELLLRTGLRERRARARVHSIREFDRTGRHAGLEKMRGVSIGFGPFSLLKREVLPRRAGLQLNEWLQAMALRDVPIARSMGHVYVLVARKGHGNVHGACCT